MTKQALANPALRPWAPPAPRTSSSQTAAATAPAPSATEHAAAAQPDLVLDSVTSSVSKPYPDEPVSFDLTVSNRGAAAAGPFDVEVRGNDDNRSARVTSGLQPGQSAHLHLGPLWARYGDSQMSVQATVDPSNEVVESSKANNSSTLALPMQYPAGTHPVAQPPQASPAPGTAAELDFTHIDTAQKAAVLPALIPPMMLTTLAGMAYASQDRDSYDVGIQMSLGQASTANLSYHMSADPQHHELRGEGSFAGQATQESYLLDGSGYHITGHLGSNDEQLSVTGAEGNRTLAGTVGSVPVQAAIVGNPDGNGSTLDGMFKGVPVHEVLTQLPVPNGLPTLHLEGHVGNEPVLADETITIGDQEGIVLHVDGVIAGVPVHYEHSVLTTQEPSR
jgi:CARDB